MNDTAPTANRVSNFGGLLRLLLAGGLMAWLVPYSWARVLVIMQLGGAPEPQYMGYVLAGVLASAGLLYGCRDAPAIRRWRTAIVALAVVGWCAVNVAVVWVGVDPLSPRWALSVLYPLAASPWFWIVWMYFVTDRPATRMLGLVVTSGFLALFLGLVRVDDLSGGAKVYFVWRWEPKKQLVSNLAAAPKTVDANETTEPLPTTGHDFPQYLGPHRTAAIPDVHLDPDWPSHPPRELWRKPVGQGWSGFAVVGDLAVTQEQRGEKECVVAYRLRTGDELWLHADDANFSSAYGGVGPRATPTIADGRVYTVGAAGHFNCLDARTGRRLWGHDLLQEFTAENQLHGVSGSPLVIDGRVFVCPTGVNGPSLAAYDAESGEKLWQAGEERTSYHSPQLVEFGGERQVLIHHSLGVAGHAPETGRRLWSFPWTNSEQNNAAQAIVPAGGPDRVFVSTGYGQGAALFSVTRSGSEFTPRKHWETRDMQNKFTTSVLIGQHIYGLDNGVLACLDVATGRRLWKKGRYGHGQILQIGELLIVQAERGDVVLVEPRPAGPRELGRLAALHGKTWNNPAFASGLLLVRNDEEAACYELAMLSP